MKKIGLKENILELRNQGLSYNEIQKKLQCSKSIISYYCNTYSIKDILVENQIEKDNIRKTFKKNNSLTKTSKEFNISRVKVIDIIGKTKKIECEFCHKELEVSNFCPSKFCSDECKKLYRREYNKNRNYSYDFLVKWRNKNKEKAVIYKGGKCVICGYDKCMRSLDFHHINPTQKEFTISKYKNKKFENLKEELDKCILVCSNCHGEIHDGLHKEFIENLKI